MKLHKPTYPLLVLVSAFALCLLLITISVIRQRQNPASSQLEASSSSRPEMSSAEENASVQSPGEDSSAPPPPAESSAASLEDCADPFLDTAFVGNSFVFDLKNYGLIPSADFYGRVGLTVRTVFTESVAGSTIPVIDELKAKQYKTVILVFGENELGWVYPEIFKEEYAKVIDAVRERQPSADIYVQAIFPVSAAASAKNEYNTNNLRIREYNQLLEALAAETGAGYLDPGSEMQDSDGCLPDEAAADGIHPNIQYCQLWVHDLRTHLKGAPS